MRKKPAKRTTPNGTRGGTSFPGIYDVVKAAADQLGLAKRRRLRHGDRRIGLLHHSGAGARGGRSALDGALGVLVARPKKILAR